MLTKQVTKSLREPTRFPVGPPRTEGAPLTAERPSICSQPSHPTITHGELGSATPVLPANNYGQTPPGCCLKKEVVLWSKELGCGWTAGAQSPKADISRLHHQAGSRPKFFMMQARTKKKRRHLSGAKECLAASIPK